MKKIPTLPYLQELQVLFLCNLFRRPLPLRIGAANKRVILNDLKARQ